MPQASTTMLALLPATTHLPCMASSSSTARPLLLSRWLLAVAVLVVLIVVVGGITRLTESGLSITEWKPVTGALPPLSDAQWQAEFTAYKRIPQYVDVNGPAGMTLGDYKFIYFWEWSHRLLGRVIGLAMALPLAWFWVRRQIPPGYKWRLVALLALIGLQGTLGWLMVRSGLTDRTVVDPHWLAAHLLTALFTLGGLVWTALDLRALARGEAGSRVTGLGAGALAMLAVQLFLGAQMAGMRAGHVAGDWPLMQGRVFPEGVDWSGGAIHALFYDPYLTHFVHRWWAWAVAGVLIVLASRVKRVRRPASIAIHAAFGTQILLGIFTVWSGIALWLATAHQLVGALLVAATAWGVHVVGRTSIAAPAREPHIPAVA
jgi:cytochrome c oxidase assembly protein subunit 15